MVILISLIAVMITLNMDAQSWETVRSGECEQYEQPHYQGAHMAEGARPRFRPVWARTLQINGGRTQKIMGIEQKNDKKLGRILFCEKKMLILQRLQEVRGPKAGFSLF